MVAGLPWEGGARDFELVIGQEGGYGAEANFLAIFFHSVPGEFAQHDLGQIVVECQDGTTERILFFASQLRHSRTN
ncbi:hypothetical protein Poly30_48270 [Planctomycetes bacterium Poly30]|uniref:Uncharacterized protein n=1 Tax=Saltatorellus ferox TaxID=2528018 RepID=A0A518EYV3_9BACT|nr:hypothetical protein Poly30_48270 [Planctomycetes bacterium Poly30]